MLIIGTDNPDLEKAIIQSISSFHHTRQMNESYGKAYKGLTSGLVTALGQVFETPKYKTIKTKRGRKPKFNEEQIIKIKEYLNKGRTITQAARKFKSSPPTITKYAST